MSNLERGLTWDKSLHGMLEPTITGAANNKTELEERRDLHVQGHGSEVWFEWVKFKDWTASWSNHTTDKHMNSTHYNTSFNVFWQLAWEDALICSFNMICIDLHAFLNVFFSYLNPCQRNWIQPGQLCCLAGGEVPGAQTRGTTFPIPSSTTPSVIWSYVIYSHSYAFVILLFLLLILTCVFVGIKTSIQPQQKQVQLKATPPAAWGASCDRHVECR